MIKTVNAELQKGRCKKELKKISDRIKDKSRALLGNVLRRPERDPAQETLVADEISNLPEVCRVGRPKANWVSKTAQDVWAKNYLHNNIAGGNGVSSIFKIRSILKRFFCAAKMKIS